jgi:hypothetical protein
MTTAIYSHPDCQRHDMGDWHPESPARLQAIADQLIGSHISDFLEHREAPLVALADLERNHSRKYLTLEGMLRYYPYVAEKSEFWVGLTGGLVVLSDRFQVVDV